MITILITSTLIYGLITGKDTIDLEDLSIVGIIAFGEFLTGLIVYLIMK